MAHNSARSKRLIKWGIAYAGLLLLFAAIYWLSWMYFPDSFVVNSELGLQPFAGGGHSFAAPDTSRVAVDLSAAEGARQEVTRTRGALLNKLRHNEMLASRLALRLDSLAATQRDTVRAKVNFLIDRDAAPAIQDSIAAEARLRMALSGQNVSQAPASPARAAQIGQERVNIANAHLRAVQVRAKWLTAMLSPAPALEAPRLAELIASLMDSAQTLRDSAAAIREAMLSLDSDERAVLGSVKQHRASRLSYLDFLYFSVVAGTTTGFGDIVPNTGPMRLLVALEVVSCLVVFGFFLATATDRPVS